MARTEGWPVVAANVPRRVASSVAKTGLTALDTLGPRSGRGSPPICGARQDGYFDRFAATMGGHQAAGSTDDQKKTTERFYFSQCVKDETMAEVDCRRRSIKYNRKLVVHFNGAFHSDFGQGTAERVRRRLHGRRVAVVSMLPVKDLDAWRPRAKILKRADYLLYTVADTKK